VDEAKFADKLGKIGRTDERISTRKESNTLSIGSTVGT
jgi:hypothetical protein